MGTWAVNPQLVFVPPGMQALRTRAVQIQIAHPRENVARSRNGVVTA